MPTYDYECSKCGHKFHLFQPITSEPVHNCPKCEARSQRIFVGGGGLIFKGSGFYVNDYKKTENTESAPKAPADCKKCETSCPHKKD